jgi:hypothetical protein
MILVRVLERGGVIAAESNRAKAPSAQASKRPPDLGRTRSRPAL